MTKQHECVYIIGAGFSAALGYPLISDLLLRLWPTLDTSLRKQLRKVIEFFHPGFNPEQFTSYPNVEELLSEMLINEKLFEASRRYEGTFTFKELQNLQRDLLLQVGYWFHELSNEIDWNPASGDWLHSFKNKMQRECAAIVSFNWDLVLDRLLFGDMLTRESYRAVNSVSTPILLKPHGSLNWFEHGQGRHISDEKRIEIFSKTGQHQVYAFLPYRAPISKNSRTYLPLIVPPVHLKELDKPIFTTLWQETVSVLSTARRVVFLGYSMPANDLHVQFIMRCGFHNQIEGVPTKGRRRKSATGPADVVIVNPDHGAARRTAAVVGPRHLCQWFSMPVADWLRKEAPE